MITSRASVTTIAAGDWMTIERVSGGDVAGAIDVNVSAL
jgi:hypothetical protein